MPCTPATLPAIDHNFEQVKLLFDYTKFHIGLYTTLAAAFITLLASKRAEKWQIIRWLVGVALVAVVVAGGAGGVIASTLPKLTHTANFWSHKTAPSWSGLKGFEIETWTHIEHGAFWVAILATVASIAPAVFKKPPDAEPSQPLSVNVAGRLSIDNTPPSPPPV